jgi:hypothetical protein
MRALAARLCQHVCIQCACTLLHTCCISTAVGVVGPALTLAGVCGDRATSLGGRLRLVVRAGFTSPPGSALLTSDIAPFCCASVRQCCRWKSMIDSH